MNRELISLALNGVEDRFISEASVFRSGNRQEAGERHVRKKSKRILSAALAAAILLALGITAYAVPGFLRSVARTTLPKTAEYTSLADLPKIEKDVGFPVTALETFSNGYGFASLRVEGEAVFGENNEILKEFYAVRVTYSKPGASDLYLELSPVLERPDETAAPEPDEIRAVNGVDVRLSLDHYKLVPEGYEKTDEDLTREAAGHYYITYGPETITECDYGFAGFELRGVQYLLMDMSASAESLDQLAQMAGELIAADRG